MTEIDTDLIDALTGYLQTAYGVVFGLARGEASSRISVPELARTASIPHVRQSEVITVLGALEQHGIVRKHGDTWSRVSSQEDLDALGYAFLGAQAQKEISARVIELERPEVVLTRPRAPSQLDQIIGDDASLLVHIENTDDAFASLAASARRSLTIMTPFLDDVGAKWAIALFETAGRTVSKELILRFLQNPESGQYPEGLPSIEGDLNRLQVEVFDFAVPRPDSLNFFETFHAKVISADGERAYVGSANLSRHSKEASMELGMLVSGSAAAHVNDILDKIRSIAIPSGSVGCSRRSRPGNLVD